MAENAPDAPRPAVPNAADGALPAAAAAGPQIFFPARAAGATGALAQPAAAARGGCAADCRRRSRSQSAAEHTTAAIAHAQLSAKTRS